MEKDPSTNRNRLPHVTRAELETFLDKNRQLTPRVQNGIHQSVRSHGRQQRDNGAPYLHEHIFPMAVDIVRAHAYDKRPLLEDTLIATLLHDAVEDDPNFSIEQCLRQFGREVAIDVALLTKRPEENDPHFDESVKRSINARLLKAIEDSQRLSAQCIKLADRTNNLESAISIRRSNPPKFDRYLLETAQVYVPFARKVSPYFHGRLVGTLERLIRSSGA